MTEKGFAELVELDVSDHVEQKNGFNYISWAWAWKYFKKYYPDAKYTKHVNEETGLPAFGNAELGYMVKLSVTAGGETVTEYYAVTDYKNATIKKPTTADINNALQRGLVKTFAMFGLGLYLYGGEDLPEEVVEKKMQDVAEAQKLEGLKAGVRRKFANRFDERVLKDMTTVEEVTAYGKKLGANQ